MINKDFPNQHLESIQINQRIVNLFKFSKRLSKFLNTTNIENTLVISQRLSILSFV